MNEVFRVAIHHRNDNGYIEYDLTTKKMNVVLADETKRQEVEKYLASEHTIRTAQKTLIDFEAAKTIPGESIEKFKLALTRLWENTGVLVDWSRPVA